MKLPIETKLVIFAVGVFATIVVRAITSERPIKNTSQQEPAGSEAKRPSGNNEPNGPSADFAALIHAIAHEGEANRAEGKAEDRGRKFRESITILLLIATTLGVYWQIHEMIKVYEPIAEQARTAEENRIADQRAWIGVIGATADSFFVTSPPTPIGTTIFYANTGREPARLSISSHEFTFPGDIWSNRKFPIKIMEWHDQCFATHDKFDSAVRNGQAIMATMAFPTLGKNWRSWYSPPPTDGTVVADNDIISGRKVIVILACFLYTSVGVVRHTTFCGVDALGKEVSTTFSLCPVGNDAD